VQKHFCFPLLVGYTVISLRSIPAFVWFLHIVNFNAKTTKAGMERSEMTDKNDQSDVIIRLFCFDS